MQLDKLPGIGIKTKEALNLNNIYTVADLIYTFPKEYLAYEIDNSKAFSGENVTIEGEVLSNPYYIDYKFKTNCAIFYIGINNIKLKCVYFTSDYLKYKLFKGNRIMLFGKYKESSNEFICRKIFLDNIESKVDVHYKLDGINDSRLNKAIAKIFSKLNINEVMPLELIMKYRLLDIKSYLYLSHLPNNSNDIKEVLRRRKYEEFFWYSIRLEIMKRNRDIISKPAKEFDTNYLKSFIDSLSFKLTNDQLLVINEILEDLKKPTPMNRLVQGDVGCGKSIVAIISSLAAINSGYQVAMMVPTEILAVQQYNEAKRLLEPLGLNVGLLTAGTHYKTKNKVLEDLRDGNTDLVIGTHALLTENVEILKLGLIIIDEQHRFGVKQRARLRHDNALADALYLTATPIPRSLGLTYFGDLDLSSIKSMPEGRLPIKTMIIGMDNLKPLFKSIENHIALGEQCYCVVPLVDNIEGANRIDINDAKALLENGCSKARIGIIHGRMKGAEKQAIMDDFKNHEIDILISTTVIEVGVSVSNATMMIILNAECFGLATLHQLRGRVGRGKLQGYCCLVTADISNDRLIALSKTNDGFIIAEEDFRLRGPGDYLGEEQSGLANLTYASFENDYNIFSCAREDAREYLPKYLAKECQSPVFKRIFEENKIKKSESN